MNLIPLNSIKSKLVAGSTLLLAAICVLGYTSSVSRLEEQSRQAISEQGHIAAEILAAQIAEPLAHRDREGVEEGLASVDGASHLLFAVVTDESSHVVASLVSEPSLISGFARGKTYRPPPPSPALHTVMTPALNGSQSVGMVYMGFSIDDKLAQIADSKLSAAVL